MAANYVTNQQLEDALERFYQKIKEDQQEYRDENMNRLDEVMGELQNIREDNTIGTYQARELRENVDDHEKRIKKLETS